MTNLSSKRKAIKEEALPGVTVKAKQTFYSNTVFTLKLTQYRNENNQ